MPVVCNYQTFILAYQTYLHGAQRLYYLRPARHLFHDFYGGWLDRPVYTSLTLNPSPEERDFKNCAEKGNASSKLKPVVPKAAASGYCTSLNIMRPGIHATRFTRFGNTTITL